MYHSEDSSLLGYDALMMEAVLFFVFVFDLFIQSINIQLICTSEMSVYLYETTQCHIPEVCRFYTHQCENLKSYYILFC
jgi:hypothetical protein